MSILRRLLASAIVLVLLPTTFCSASATMNAKYHIFKFSSPFPLKPSTPYAHPLLKDGRGYVVVLSVQEEDMLKVAFCGKTYGVRFEDGTTLYAPLPPSDAYPSGTQEWMYQMRWRRVYGNYYLITVFRSMGNAVQEELMTERDNKDLRPILGDSSAEEHPRFGGAIICNSLDYIDEQGNRTSYELVPVEEKDLPPDFPKGLVRWLP